MATDKLDSLPWIPQDYANHACYGFGGGVVATALGGPLFALYAVLSVGAAKKVYDYFVEHETVETCLQDAGHGYWPILCPRDEDGRTPMIVFLWYAIGLIFCFFSLFSDEDLTIGNLFGWLLVSWLGPFWLLVWMLYVCAQFNVWQIVLIKQESLSFWKRKE